MKLKKIKQLKAFTLVELIIVITILAILATIAFISFQGYTKDSRDGNRLATINSVSKGLDLFQVKTGNYPIPENITGTGIVNEITLAFVGNIADSISRVINVNKTPQDPLSKTNYIYGTDVTKTKYQIATVLEDTQANNILIEKTYADSGYKAKVTGNYNGLLKVGTSLYNLPSLIFTGSGNLISTDTYFVADKSQNLPYKLNSIDPNNTQTTSQILTLLKSTATALTGVTITDWNSQSGSLSTSLGYAIDTIGQGYYGDKYFTEIKDKLNTNTIISPGPVFTETSPGSGIFKTSDGKLTKIIHNSIVSDLNYNIMTYNPANLTSGEGWSYGSNDPQRAWGCHGISVSTMSFTGQQNTINLVNSNCKNGINNTGNLGPDYIAANFCDNLTITVDGTIYNDWYLPSGDPNNGPHEIQILFNNKTTIGGFNETGVLYWSSSQTNSTSGYDLRFNNPNSWYTSLKYDDTVYVRCIRIAE